MFTHADQAKLASKRIRKLHSSIGQEASYGILAALCGKDSAHEMWQALKKGPLPYPKTVHGKAVAHMAKQYPWMDPTEVHDMAKPFIRNPYAPNEIPGWACVVTSGLALEAIQKQSRDVVVFHSSGPGLLGAFNAVAQGMEARTNPEKIVFIQDHGRLPLQLGAHQRIVPAHEDLSYFVRPDEIAVSWGFDYEGSMGLHFERRPRIVFIETNDIMSTLQQQYQREHVGMDVDSIHSTHALIPIDMTPEGPFAMIDPKVFGNLSFEFYDKDEGARDQRVRIYGDVPPEQVIFVKQ